MNLAELELYKNSQCEEGSCELKKPKTKDDKEEDFSGDLGEKLLDDCVAKVCSFMFGKDWDHQVKEKSRKKIRSIISDCLQLEVVEQVENDLGETLDLLEDSLFMMERILTRKSHSSLAGSMKSHMEAVAEHLEQWGMGDSKDAEKRALDQMKDRFRD